MRCAVALVFLAAALMGCSSLLGDFSLSGAAQDGGPDVVGSTDAPGSSDSMGGSDGGDATMGDSGMLDSGTSDSSAVDSSVADSTVADSSPVDSGAVDTGVPDTGAVDSGVDTGVVVDSGPPFSCGLASAYERSITGDGGLVSADNLVVYNASQTNVIALVKAGSGPSTAYSFRSDRPGDAVQTVQLGTGTSRLLSSTRSVGNNATLALSVDSTNSLLLYDWPDNSGIGAPPVTAATTTNYSAVKMVSTQAGLFYAAAIGGQGTYVDFETTPTTPNITASSNEISTLVDTGLSDGTRAYRMSNDDVMLIYYGSDSTFHQDIYPAGMAATTLTRQFFAGQMIPFSFLANGSNVDISAAIADDAGGFGLYVGSIPESQLATFDLQTSLTEVGGVGISSQPCAAAWPGNLVFLAPTLAGMDMYVIDVATGAVTYSLTGAANIAHSDTAIVSCGIGYAGVLNGVMTLDVVWADNVGATGMQTLLTAPIECTL